MSGGHAALIVEDDDEIVEELRQILESLSCAIVVADNKKDALEHVRRRAFCFVLLDLEIKAESGSIKGHRAHGESLLRELRRRHPQHSCSGIWMPILIVSAYARETPAAVAVMKDGANDVIQKPFTSRDLTDGIRDALSRSGRSVHDACEGADPAPRVTGASEPVLLSVPGDRDRRRTVVAVGLRRASLPDRSLKTLLRLMIAHTSGKGINKLDLGGTANQGFKGISELREMLKGALDVGVDIIPNEYGGVYRLAGVEIGDCNAGALSKIGDQVITRLARQLAGKLSRQRRKRRSKSEGNF
jgi:DNA-binding response OmpR family regulator